jgi:hypothetical protein
MIQEKINELFKKYNLNLTTEEVKLAEATLEDGTVIYSDSESWEQGVNVYILNDEGEKIPVPMGEYTLADGTKVILLEDGIFDSLVAAEEEVEASEEPQGLTREQAMQIVEEAVNVLKGEFSAQISTKDEEIKALKEELSASQKEVEKVKFEFSTKGLPKAVVTKPSVTREELANMKPQARVTALFNKLK